MSSVLPHCSLPPEEAPVHTSYCKGSPKALIMTLIVTCAAFGADLLPWAAILHCALGLWMHTYFRTKSQSALVSWLGASGLTPTDLRELNIGLIVRRVVQVQNNDSCIS